MNELISEITSALRGMWRRRWAGLLIAWVVGVLGIGGLLRMPDRYEATARVFVDTKSVLKPLMRDLAVEPDIDQTINMLARTIITRPNIELLMGKGNLDLGPMSPEERERTIEVLLRDIKLTASGRDNVFSFSFRDTDPQRARLVVEKLVSLFVAADLGSKARDTEAARTFIDEQIKALEARLAEAEGRLKDFKVRNIGIADSSGKDYFARMSALSEELARINVDLRASEQSRDALKRELSGETASLVPETPAPVAAQILAEGIATPELDSRLDAQRRQLDELLRRYTELHPDVVATRRVISRLEEQKAVRVEQIKEQLQQEAEAKRRAALAKPQTGSTASNQATQQIKFALAEAEAAVAALRVRAADLQSRVNQLRASATRVPQVEAEMAQLNRDYEIIRRNYETMVSRREKAALSEDVEATRPASFRVIDPPRTSPKPVFPNRLALAPFVLLVALALGAAGSFLIAQLLPTFESAASLLRVTQRPVLGSVSALLTKESVRRSRQNATAFAMAMLGLIVVYGAWITWMSRSTGV
jgi:polysaccharide chain length determinant protein (PEP-CTERM system associated)